ncbi:MAG TPA: SAM-dependent methyltransferase [Candidatus Sulfotelmatobacter sp.]|nr:SAM-dependent methyltransferase [Candidatus Sulfotelmatobacter sp.]
MNPLERMIRAEIAASGPMDVAEFMARALGDPVHGYYRTRDPLGAKGDFITAPEVSQMFGELIGLWCAETWQRLGAPTPVHLVELGPGRGTLMADALRATARAAPAFRAALDLHLVETSPALRDAQRARLAGAAPTWHDDVASVPDGPALIVANEFLDALPIHQLARTEDGWCARQIAPDDADRLAFRIARAPSPLADELAPEVARAPLGAIAELSMAARGLVGALARRCAVQGGGALLIDYGPAESAAGDSLQAVRRHRPHPVLEDPGEADLTAHVDFAALARAARGHAAVHGPLDQGTFLRRLGIAARAEALFGDKPATIAAAGRAALARLIEPGQMGTLFKVMALGAPGAPTPPGFEP